MAFSGKLLFILFDRPNFPSGPIVNYLRLLPALVAKGYDVHLLVVYRSDYPNARILQNEKITIHPKAEGYTEHIVPWVLAKAEEIQPDVFIPDIYAPAGLASKWLMNAGIPAINTHRGPSKLNVGKAKYFSSPVYGYEVTALVSVNQHLLSQLQEEIGPIKSITAIIPSGVVVPAEFVNQETAANGLRIVYSGRLIQEAKNVLAVIDSFLSLCEKHSDITLTIIGDGPEKNNCLAKVSATPYASRFVFKGQLLGDAYKNELMKHHVIVLLSDYEGTPGSLMDGMAAGLVPVCLHYPGVDELISHEKNGLFVTDRGASFSEAITKLKTDTSLRTRLAQAARTTIVESFSLEVAVARWVELFEQCKRRMGEKKKFVAPKKVQLPPYSPLLVEDKRISNVSWYRRFGIWFPVLKKLKKFRFLQKS